MIVVSDTGPLNYLILVDHFDKLPALYGEIAIPRSVAGELLHPSSPAAVRATIQSAPSWLSFHEVIETEAELADLGLGEQHAIILARTLSAGLLLCDDKDARVAAVSRNLQVVGTLGVLIDAADHGLLELGEAVERLRRTNFRISKYLLNGLLKQEDI